jgi:hypothetical protein
MKGKKAFELTATFLVILILTIVIFTGAIYFTRRFFSTAEQMRAEIDAQTEREIEALLYQEGSLVAMPKFKKAIARGQHTTFGLGIRNVLDEAKDFWVLVEFKNAYTEDETQITGTSWQYIDSKWLLYSQGPYRIQNNELQIVPILATADLQMATRVSTEKGIYAFNVCVFSQDPGGFRCAEASPPLPEHIYGGKVYKMYVEVI